MDLLKAALDFAIDSPPAQWAVHGLVRLLPEPHLAVTYQDVVVPGLPRGLEGLRILHVSDLHLAPGSELACELPDVAARLPHDLVLYTGDFIDADAGIAPVAALLGRMPRVEGAYAVLGNHDYRPYGRVRGANDVSALRHALSGAGLEVLTNAARPVCGSEFFVAGVDDPATYHDDLDRALGGVPAGACCLLLAHTPDIVLRLRGHRPNLILAGHTHGGQIRLPLLGPLVTMSRLPRDKIMGLQEFDGIPLFVTRGIGYSGLDIRIGCPPEVALLTLRSPLAAERVA
jgi:predicted MPP superfamily phosphohydrolase